MIKNYISAQDISYQLANLKQLTFEVTDACNLNCKYCAYGEFYNDYDQRKNSMMSLPAAINLIDHLVKYWTSEINMSVNKNVFISFYGGEPLLNMPFIEAIVDYVEKLKCPNRNFTFSMTTNALLLERYMDYLVEHDFSLLLSLDGDEQGTSYRVDHAGNSSFNRVFHNVNLLKDNYPEYFERKVNFNAVLHNRNSVEEIYRFIKENYNKIPNIGELNDMGIRQDKIELFRATYRNSYKSLHQSEHCEEIEKDMFIKSDTYWTLTSFLHQYSDSVYQDYTDLLYGKLKKTIPTGTCMPFGKRMFVTVNGKILPCERIGQHFALGRITETMVELDLEAIADKYNSYFAKLAPQCSKCHNVKACIQCIFNLHDLENCPKCHGFVSENRFVEYRERQMDFLRKHPEEYYRIMEEITIE